MQCKTVARDTAEAHFHCFRFFQAGPFTAESALAFATVFGDMLLQAGDGHRHPHRQLPLFDRRKVSEPYQPPHPTARLDELAFEPSMFWTTYRQSRSRIHYAPVENRESQISTMAKKKQIVFSPYIRLRAGALALKKLFLSLGRSTASKVAGATCHWVRTMLRSGRIPYQRRKTTPWSETEIVPCSVSKDTTTIPIRMAARKRSNCVCAALKI